jgi:IPT/TIG domain
VARRLSILLPILVLLTALSSYGALDTVPTRSSARKSPPAPPAETGHQPVTLLSIIPAQGEPGTTITLYGSGFTPKTTVFLANREVPAEVIGPEQLSFEIPKLDPGLYALFVKREDGATSRLYNFTILAVRPAVSSLSPDTVYACATGSERNVTVLGDNFVKGSQVIFDGSIIRTRFISPESLGISAPQIAGGLHQVQVKNPDGALSGVIGLIIDARPEITGVTRGEEFVNYYNLIIEGRNFQQDSSLVVMQQKSLQENPTQFSVDVKRISTGSGSVTEQEQLIYINCNRVVYQRHPYSTTPKNFSIQVINPGSSGESSVISVSAP